MNKSGRHYCHVCGGRLVRETDDEGNDRDFCQPCSRFFYDNPLPVVSAIVTMDRWILFVRRGKRPYKGLWCLPTGFAESGESIGEAVLRELEEEAGIRGRIAGLVDVDSYRSRYYGDLLFLTFEVEQEGGVLQPGTDTTAVRFFPLDALPRIAFPSNRKAIEAFIRSKEDYWAIVDSFRESVGGGQEGVRKNLLSDRLVGVIEENAESIARNWLKEALTSRSTAGYHLFGRERLFRDVRITNIYEGTSQLQVVAAIGKLLNRSLDPLLAEWEAADYPADMAAEKATLVELTGLLGRAIDGLKLPGEEKIGAQVVREALAQPLRQIADNAGAITSCSSALCS